MTRLGQHQVLHPQVRLENSSVEISYAWARNGGGRRSLGDSGRDSQGVSEKTWGMTDYDNPQDINCSWNVMFVYIYIHILISISQQIKRVGG